MRYPRYAEAAMLEALEDSPALFIHGARQCGKTTLARHVGGRLGHTYLSFDDDNQRQSAQADPVGFVRALPHKVILDEIQRVPELLTSLKAAIDASREAGRFILTGSANALLLPRLADSLAGRMALLRLRPLARCEVAGKRSRLLAHLLDSADLGTSLALRQHQPLGLDLAALIVAGGYPTALERASERRRAAWYRDYGTALIQRDIQDIANIRHLDSLPRLLELAAGQTARLFNASDLAAPFAISRPTIREYLTLLEQVFLLEQLQPWHRNRLSRLVKTPKLHLADTGLASALLGVGSAALWEDKALLGQLLETFIYQELRKQADWSGQDFRFYHYRDKDKLEVDIVIEQGRKVAGVEVKASATVTRRDFKGLRRLKDASQGQFAAGIVLYDGDSVLPFGDNLFAVPIAELAVA